MGVGGLGDVRGLEGGFTRIRGGTLCCIGVRLCLDFGIARGRFPLRFLLRPRFLQFIRCSITSGLSFGVVSIAICAVCLGTNFLVYVRQRLWQHLVVIGTVLVSCLGIGTLYIGDHVVVSVE